MKRILLATTAVMLLSLPAAAQGMNDGTKSPNVKSNPPVQSGQSYDMNATQSGAHQRLGATGHGQAISHQALSQDEIAQIQQSLNKQGFDAGNVDGIWGPETRAALRNFQRQQSLQASGDLDQQTLDALDVVAQGSASAPSATTGAGSSTGGAATTGAGATSSGSSSDLPDGKGDTNPAAASGSTSGMSGSSTGSMGGDSGASSSGGSQ